MIEVKYYRRTKRNLIEDGTRVEVKEEWRLSAIQRCVSLLSADKAGENDEASSCFEGQSNGVKSPPVATWNERSHGNELVAQALRPSAAFPPFFLDFRLPQFLSPFPSTQTDTRVFSLFFFNLIELRNDAYQIFGRSVKNIFIFLVFKSLSETLPIWI